MGCPAWFYFRAFVGKQSPVSFTLPFGVERERATSRSERSCPRSPAVLSGHEVAVNAVLAVGDLVVTASGDTTIRLWTAEGAALSAQTVLPNGGQDSPLHFRGEVPVAASLGISTSSVWSILGCLGFV